MRPSLFWRVRSADWMRSAWRTPEEGSISTDARRFLELLIPHVQTALRVHRALGTAEQRQARTGKRWQMPAPPRPLCLPEMAASNTAKTTSWNRCRGSDILTVVNGHLSACQPEDRASLAKLLQDTVSPSYCFPSPRPATYYIAPRPRKPAPATAGHAAAADAAPWFRRRPAAPDHRSDGFPDARSPRALRLYPSGIGSGQRPDDELLRRGDRLPAAGLAGTVRQQVKSMLNKTGCSRQSAMVRSVTTLPQMPAPTCQS